MGFCASAAGRCKYQQQVRYWAAVPRLGVSNLAFSSYLHHHQNYFQLRFRTLHGMSSQRQALHVGGKHILTLQS
jgi:hypothetical protein